MVENPYTPPNDAGSPPKRGEVRGCSTAVSLVLLIAFGAGIAISLFYEWEYALRTNGKCGNVIIETVFFVLLFLGLLIWRIVATCRARWRRSRGIYPAR